MSEVNSLEKEQAYKNMYVYLHAQGDTVFYGYQTILLANQINLFFKYYNIKTVLDYGCGKANHYFVNKLHKTLNLEKVFLYDIGVIEYSIKPPRDELFDCVLCIDVMEHLEEFMVDDVIKDLIDYSDKLVIISIALREARKILPDGRNAHLCIKPREWWIEKIRNILFESKNNPRIFILFEDEIYETKEDNNENKENSSGTVIKRKLTYNFINFNEKESHIFSKKLDEMNHKILENLQT